MSILFGILTIVLVLVSIILIFLVLMQPGSQSGGIGAAMGGGAAESALGAESTTVLGNWTRNVSIVFFLLVLGLYLGNIWEDGQAKQEEGVALPSFEAQGEGADDLSKMLNFAGEAEAAAPVVEAEAAAVAEEAAAAVSETENAEAPAAK